MTSDMKPQQRMLIIGAVTDDPGLLAALHTDYQHVVVEGPLARRAANVIRAHAELAGFAIIRPGTPVPSGVDLERLVAAAGQPTMLFVDAADAKPLRHVLAARPQQLVIVVIGPSRHAASAAFVGTDMAGARIIIGGVPRPTELGMPGFRDTAPASLAA